MHQLFIIFDFTQFDRFQKFGKALF